MSDLTPRQQEIIDAINFEHKYDWVTYFWLRKTIPYGNKINRTVISLVNRGFLEEKYVGVGFTSDLVGFVPSAEHCAGRYRLTSKGRFA